MVDRIKAELLEPVSRPLLLGRVKIKSLEELHSTLKTAPKSHIKKTEIINWLDNFPGLMLLQTQLKTHKGDFRKKSVKELNKILSYLKGEVSFKDYVRNKCIEHMKSQIVVNF